MSSPVCPSVSRWRTRGSRGKSSWRTNLRTVSCNMRCSSSSEKSIRVSFPEESRPHFTKHFLKIRRERTQRVAGAITPHDRFDLPQSRLRRVAAFGGVSCRFSEVRLGDQRHGIVVLLVQRSKRQNNPGDIGQRLAKFIGNVQHVCSRRPRCAFKNKLDLEPFAFLRKRHRSIGLAEDVKGTLSPWAGGR